MTMLLHCSQGSEHERTTRLEQMGLLRIIPGEAILNGGQEDRANQYVLRRYVEQQDTSRSSCKQYTLLEMPSVEKGQDPLLLDLAPRPEEDRWRQEQYGPTGWLMAADPLADAPFTVAAMSDRLGLSTDAVRRTVKKMAQGGLAAPGPAGTWTLDVPCAVTVDVWEWLMDVATDLPQAEAFRLLKKVIVADTSLSERQREALAKARAHYDAPEDLRRLYAQLKMRRDHPGRGPGGTPLLPPWTQEYDLHITGWLPRVPGADTHGWPSNPVVPLAQTWTHRPRNDAAGTAFKPKAMQVTAV